MSDQGDSKISKTNDKRKISKIIEMRKESPTSEISKTNKEK